MQRLLKQPISTRSIRSFPTTRVCDHGIGVTPALQIASRLVYELEGDARVATRHTGALKLFSRSFGSAKHWKPRTLEESLDLDSKTIEKWNDGPQQVQYWENDAGALVAEHDEIETIECCQWVIRSVCERLRQRGGKPKQALSTLKALRFLLDLEETIERLSDEGFGTCAIELFERPWVVACDRNTEILRLRPRPDGVLRRAAFAALSPVFAPLGALHTYCKSGGRNALASFKWYFRAVAEVPTKVELDRSYRIEGVDRDPEACLSLEDARRLVVLHRKIPQLAF